MSTSTFTYQTRLRLAPEQAAMLDAYAELYGKVERTLFARLCAGEEADRLKSSFCAEFGITARQYNAVSVGLKGKIDSIKERRTGLMKELDSRVSSAEKVVKKLTKVTKATKATKQESAEASASRFFKIHHKKRRHAALRRKSVAMHSDHDLGKVRMAFGSKKLFRAQFALKENGYESIDAWREDWAKARSAQFMVLGSKDETAGCQGCVATIDESAENIEAKPSLTLRLRMPDTVLNPVTHVGKYLVMGGVSFAYGHAKIVAALNSYRATTVVGTKGKSLGKPVRQVTGTALTYRFVKDDKGWRVFVAVAVEEAMSISNSNLGAIGVDFNADHLAVSETDRFGNLVNTRRIDAVTYGKTRPGPGPAAS